MLDSLIRILTDICLPIFVLIFAGWALDRAFRLELRTLVKLNIYFFVPCFIFRAILTTPFSGGLAGRVVLFTAIMILTMGFVSRLYALVTGLDRQRLCSLQLSTMFYNCGNYGLPLMALAFPEPGALAPGMQVFALMTMNIATFSLAPIIAVSSGLSEQSASWRHFLPCLRQPSLFAVGSALVLSHLGWDQSLKSVPSIWVPIDYASNALIAFALMTLGVQLSQTKPPKIEGALQWGLFQRLLLGPAIAWLLTLVFKLPKEIEVMLILGAGVPTAVNTALIAHEFGADTAFATAAVFYSTLMSVATITIILLFIG